MYLVALIDVYSRYVVGWALSNTLDTAFCIDALKSGMYFATPEILFQQLIPLLLIISRLRIEKFTKILKVFYLQAIASFFGLYLSCLDVL